MNIARHENSAGVSAPGEVAGNHRHNGLRQAADKLVALQDEHGTALGRPQIGVRKEHQHHRADAFKFL
jgi:hypothetical protein